MKNNKIAYALIGFGVLALLARLGSGAGWFWVGLVAAALLVSYTRTKKYGILIPACILTGVAVGLLLEVSLRMHGAFLISIGMGFLAIDRVEPRKNRWPVIVGAIVAVLGFLIGLAEIGAIGSLWLALILIGGGIYMLRQRLESTVKAKPNSEAKATSSAVEQVTKPEATSDVATTKAVSTAKTDDTVVVDVGADASVVPLEAPKAETVSIEAEGAERAETEAKSTQAGETELVLDKALYEQLTVWRRDTAKEEERAAYLILTNKSLEQIARDKPANLKDLKNIKGIGPVKLERYGEAILKLVNAEKGTEV